MARTARSRGDWPQISSRHCGHVRSLLAVLYVVARDPSDVCGVFLGSTCFAKTKHL